MLKKYLLNSLKYHPLKYSVLVICEIVTVVVSLVSSSIILDYAVENSGTSSQANCFTYSFNRLANEHYNLANLSAEEEAEIEQAKSELPYVTDLREKIYDFCENVPEVFLIDFTLSGLDENVYFYESNYFPTYENMVYYFTEYNEKYWSLSADNLPTLEQYLSCDKVVILGTGIYRSDEEYVFSGDGNLLWGKNKDAYKIVGEIPESGAAYFLFGSEPDYAQIRSVRIELDDYYSKSRCEEIAALFREIVGDDTEIYYERLPMIDELLNSRKQASVVLLIMFMIIICVFNVVIIFKYIVDEKKAELAVFRLCGYSRRKAMMFPLSEALIISAIGAVIGCVAFDAFMPYIKKICATAELLFNFEFYALFVVGFLLFTLLLFAVYILPSLKRSLSSEMREM